MKHRLLQILFKIIYLSPPVYTRPSNYEGMKVPEILLSGNFPKIDEWRSDKAYERTQQIRPDLLDETS